MVGCGREDATVEGVEHWFLISELKFLQQLQKVSRGDDPSIVAIELWIEAKQIDLSELDDEDAIQEIDDVAAITILTEDDDDPE